MSELRDLWNNAFGEALSPEDAGTRIRDLAAVLKLLLKGDRLEGP